MKRLEGKAAADALSGRVNVAQKISGTKIIAVAEGGSVSYFKKGGKKVGVVDLLLGDFYDAPISLLDGGFKFKDGCKYFFTFSPRGRLFLDDAVGDPACALQCAILAKRFSYDKVPEELLAMVRSGHTAKLSKAMGLDSEASAVIFETSSGKFSYQVRRRRPKPGDFSAMNALSLDVVRRLGMGFFNTITISDTRPDWIYAATVGKMFRYYVKAIGGEMPAGVTVESCRRGITCDISKKLELLGKVDAGTRDAIAADERLYYPYAVMLMMFLGCDWRKNPLMGEEDRIKMTEITGKLMAVCRDNVFAVGIPSLEDIRIYN